MVFTFDRIQLSIINANTPSCSYSSGYQFIISIGNYCELVLPITPTLEHLLDPDKATSLTWTLLEWFSPIPWWRKKLQQLSEMYNLERMPASEAQMFTSVFIIHRPYFRQCRPDQCLFRITSGIYVVCFPSIYSNRKAENPFKTFFISGYITQNRLSFSLKQGTKPDKKNGQKFSDAQDPCKRQVQSILPQVSK